MKFKGWQKTTLLDYPGKIACTVFVTGCNFRCPFCQNPELVLEAETLPTIPEEEILKFLKRRRGLLEGVVITGGEPTLYPDLPKFAKKVKDLGFLVKLDTNGTNPEMLKDLFEWDLVDYVAMDIKGPIEEYEKYIGQTQILNLKSKIKKSIGILLKGGIEFEFRTTVVPTLHTEEDLIEMAKEFDQLPIKWYLQGFRPIKCLDPKFEKIRPYPKEFFDKILPKLRKYLPKTFLRGFWGEK